MDVGVGRREPCGDVAAAGERHGNRVRAAGRVREVAHGTKDVAVEVDVPQLRQRDAVVRHGGGRDRGPVLAAHGDLEPAVRARARM